MVYQPLPHRMQWKESQLLRAAALNECDTFLEEDPPVLASIDLDKTHRIKFKYALTHIYESISEDIRLPLSPTDLHLSLHQLCKRLQSLTSANPANASYKLSSLARDNILRSGTSIADYQA